MKKIDWLDVILTSIIVLSCCFIAFSFGYISAKDQSSPITITAQPFIQWETSESTDQKGEDERLPCSRREAAIIFEHLLKNPKLEF